MYSIYVGIRLFVQIIFLFLLGPQTVSTMRKYRPTSVGVEMIGCTMKLDNPDQDGNGEVSIRDFFYRNRVHKNCGYCMPPTKFSQIRIQYIIIRV